VAAASPSSASVRGFTDSLRSSERGIDQTLEMVDASLFCAGPIPYRISTFKYQISNLPKIEVLESLRDLPTCKWLKISGGGGTQPYSAKHRVRPRPEITLTSV
jgi:hypothetical protein